MKWFHSDVKKTKRKKKRARSVFATVAWVCFRHVRARCHQACVYVCVCTPAGREASRLVYADVLYDAVLRSRLALIEAPDTYAER